MGTTWQEAKIKSGIEFPVPVEKCIKWWAYKDGNAALCDTREEASHISKHLERTVLNQEEYADYCLAESTAHRAVEAVWDETLKEEYTELVNLGIFDLVYEQAQSRTSEDNSFKDYYDAMYMYMDELATFLTPIITKLKPKVVGWNDMD